MLNRLLIIIREYGIFWAFYRMLYEVKLRLLKKFPPVHFIFEHSVKIKRIDLIDIDVNAIKDFLKKLPEREKEEIIREADNVILGKIRAYGKVWFDYGRRIDWQQNPLTGNSCDKTKEWFCIPDFDAHIGDIKNVWEASRFSFFYCLARAYLLTEDKRYYNAFSGYLKSWLDENQYNKGANFKCGQECSIRMMNALIVYSIFEKSGVTSREDRKNLIQLLEVCYKKVRSNFFYAHRCVKIDHLIAELCGQITGAWCAGKEKRIKKFEKILMGEMKRQFSEEGLYLSYSFHYQRYVLQLMEYVFLIGKKADIRMDREAKEILYKAATLLDVVRSKDGQVPNYGSNDGTLIFKVTSCNHNDFRPTIRTIMLLTGYGSNMPDGIYDEEWLWFGDGRKKVSCHQIKESNLAKDIYTFKRNKFFVMVNAHNYKTRPAHMDQMHIDMWINDINVFCDLGSYSYADEKGDILTLTEAHNTVKVSGKEQFIRSGRFLTYGKPKVKVKVANKSTFDAYAEFISGYSHQRCLYVSEDMMELEDYIQFKETVCNWQILFHTPCEVKTEGKEVTFWMGEKLLCTLQTEADRVIVEEAQRSLYYMTLEPVKCVKLLCSKNSCKTQIRVKGL